MGKTILDEMTYDELVEHTTDVIRQLRLKAYNEG